MNIIWDEDKNDWLKVNRSISFEEISGMILDGLYMDILENPSRDNQMIFIMRTNDYTWIIPFLIDDEERIVLKIAFPSRKLHKKYGENYE